MSSDQLLASAEGSASASARHGIARDEVVVPLRTPAPVEPGAPRLHPPGGIPGGARSAVAQIADYLSRTRRHSAPEAGALRAAARPHGAAGLPASVAAHADELDGLLRRHIESHLDLIAAHAPDLARPVDNVRRSVELLLKLRRR
jgi:hypothetical protein